MKSLSVMNKPVFWNCLIVMRPRTKTKELPTTHDVNTHIHNAFVKHLEELRETFKIF